MRNQIMSDKYERSPEDIFASRVRDELKKVFKGRVFVKVINNCTFVEVTYGRENLRFTTIDTSCANEYILGMKEITNLVSFIGNDIKYQIMTHFMH